MNIKNFVRSFFVTIMIAVVSPAAYGQELTSGVIGDAVETSCVTDLGTAEVPENASGLLVVGEDSEASFSVTEELAGSGINDAVGTTNAVIGTLLIDDRGHPLECSRIDVDLRTLVTDESRRDARIQDVLSTSEHPVATFIITEISDLDGSLEDGQETSMTLIGNLTINGVEKQVSWSAAVTLADGELSATASTVLEFDDFEIEKPVLGPVMSIEDQITLTIDVAAVES